MILMQLNSEVLRKVKYLTGSAEIAESLSYVPAREPFDDEIVEYFNDVSKRLMGNKEARAFSDVVTFAFWIRKGSVLKLKERFHNNGIYLGKGVAFHIAPSNVPVNFAYSLVSGLLTGNANVVRVPSKDFPQVGIITSALNDALDDYPELKSYVICVRYERDKEINDLHVTD